MHPGTLIRWGALGTVVLLGLNIASALAAIGAQTAADATRLTQLGARRVTVTGNLKFDIAPPEAMLVLGRSLRERISNRPVLLAASTREGEEALLLDAFVRQATPEALLLLVPRHPQRFDEVAALASARGLALQRRSTAAESCWLPRPSTKPCPPITVTSARAGRPSR